ncbi:MAG: cardiolipin synthase [Bacilli bacterium]
MKIIKKTFKFLMSRVFIINFLLLIQFSFIFYFAFYLGKKGIYFILPFTILSFIMAFAILSRSFNPAYKISWIMLVLMVPFAGLFFYLMFGRLRLSKKKRLFIDELNAKTNHELAKGYKFTAFEEPDLHRISQYVFNACGFPALNNTTSQFLTPGEEMHKAMLEELRKAERFIFLEYFIISEGQMWNSIEEILIEKVKNGIDVRLIYDDFGSMYKTQTHFKKRLISLGIKVVNFNPYIPRLTMIINYRDHRKMMVIDGNVGFVGGANIADEYINLVTPFGHWKDASVMIKGEGVWNLSYLFMQMWQFATNTTFNYSDFRPTLKIPTSGFVQVFGDGPFDQKQIIEDTYLNIINQAKKYVYISSPYLVLDNEMVTALKIAAQSGVDVRIIVPHKPDKKLVFYVTQSFYATLIKFGVKIYEYEPGFIHSKVIIADDLIAMVGTANLDYRSLYYHFEVSCLLLKTESLKDIYQDMVHCFKVSHLVTFDEAKKRTILRKVIVSFLSAFSPMI